ncbi:G5 domain-containing protein [Patescibacteria group bacterium]
MIKKKKKRKLKKIVLTFFCLVVIKSIFFGEERLLNIKDSEKRITIKDGGIEASFISNANTVGELLDGNGFIIRGEDVVYPNLDRPIFTGTKVIIERPKRIKVLVDNQEIEDYTFENTVEAAVLGASVSLDEFDILSEDRDSFVYNDIEVKVTRVEKAEEVVKKNIDFDVIVKEDDDMGWRKEVIKEKGEKGVKEMTYQVIYHDGAEINRKLVNTEIVKNPKEQLIVKGTYVELGKSHTGFASWYAQPIHLKNAYPSITGYYAANPWLPKGSYVKVLNKANGKSVIARINDRGPFGPNRIIDLDKKAFAQLSSIGAGIIDVKMREVEN